MQVDEFQLEGSTDLPLAELLSFLTNVFRILRITIALSVHHVSVVSHIPVLQAEVGQFSYFGLCPASPCAV